MVLLLRLRADTAVDSNDSSRHKLLCSSAAALTAFSEGEWAWGWKEGERVGAVRMLGEAWLPSCATLDEPIESSSSREALRRTRRRAHDSASPLPPIRVMEAISGAEALGGSTACAVDPLPAMARLRRTS